MPDCPFCGRPLDESSLVEPSFESVGDCEPHQMSVAAYEQTASTDGDRLAPIARFESAAEAGYFCHELMDRESLPVTIAIDENFDAVSGRWWTHYVLRVPEEMAETAITALQVLLDESQGDQGNHHQEILEGADAIEPPSNASEERFEIFDCAGEFDAGGLGVNWVPIILTLAAGSVAFWGFRKLQDQGRPPIAAAPAGRDQRDLRDALSRHGGTWIQQSGNAGGVRHLRYEPDQKTVIIREDGEGDGIFESEAVYRF